MKKTDDSDPARGDATAVRSSAKPIDPALARALPFIVYVVFLPLVDVLARWAPGFDGRWLYGVQVGLVAVLLIAFWRGYIELHDPTKLRPRDVVLAVATGTAVFVLWINLDHPWLTIGASTGFNPSRPDGGIDVALAAIRITGAALVVPVMEELFWRSFITRWIDQRDFLSVRARAISLKALLISSLLFGIEHNLWFAGVLAGLAYGAVYRKSENLWVPTIAHAVTNAMLGAWVLHGGNWQFW